jgi:hypothetical protein
MWQLKSTKISQNLERKQFLSVFFVFVNTDTSQEVSYTEPNVPDQNSIPKLAADWLRQYNKILDQLANPISDIDIASQIDLLLNPPSPPAPTQEQLDQQAYNQAKIKLAQVNELVTNGVLLSDDQLVLDAKKAVVDSGTLIVPTIIVK